MLQIGYLLHRIIPEAVSLFLSLNQVHKKQLKKIVASFRFQFSKRVVPEYLACLAQTKTKMAEYGERCHARGVPVLNLLLVRLLGRPRLVG
jgi:hypothetical protein